MLLVQFAFQHSLVVCGVVCGIVRNMNQYELVTACYVEIVERRPPGSFNQYVCAKYEVVLSIV